MRIWIKAFKYKTFECTVFEHKAFGCRTFEYEVFDCGVFEYVARFRTELKPH